MKIFRTNRTILKADCPWLDFNFPKDIRVYEYNGPTYGVISPSGIAVTGKPDELPFFELPIDSLTEV